MKSKYHDINNQIFSLQTNADRYTPEIAEEQRMLEQYRFNINTPGGPKYVEQSEKRLARLQAEQKSLLQEIATVKAKIPSEEDKEKGRKEIATLQAQHDEKHSQLVAKFDEFLSSLEQAKVLAKEVYQLRLDRNSFLVRISNISFDCDLSRGQQEPVDVPKQHLASLLTTFLKESVYESPSEVVRTGLDAEYAKHEVREEVPA